MVSVYVFHTGIPASNLHMVGQIITMWKYKFARDWSKKLIFAVGGNSRASGAAADVKIWTTNNFRLISPVQTNSERKKSKLVFNGFSSSTKGGFCVAWFLYRMDPEGVSQY